MCNIIYTHNIKKSIISCYCSIFSFIHNIFPGLVIMECNADSKTVLSLLNILREGRGDKARSQHFQEYNNC